MTDWQGSLAGLQIGPDTPYGVTAVSGLDETPTIRSSDLDWVGQDGESPGYDRVSGRTVSLKIDVTATSTISLADALDALRAAAAPKVTVEFWYCIPGQVSLMCSVRVRRCAIATDLPRQFGLATVDLQLHATDPLKYGPPVFPTPAGLASATPGAGRVWPRVWPTDYGIAPGVTPGSITVPNAGTAAYWPRLRTDGPVLNPTITLVETGDWVRYNGALLAGQWLDWDMGNRRVLLQGQVSVRQQVSSSGAWLAIPVGGGSITWTADTADPAALLSVWGYERAVS